MRPAVILPLIALVAGYAALPFACSDETSSPWKNLLGTDLRNWSRSERGKSPWHLTADRTLIGSKAHELLIAEETLGDGTLRLEYRFRPTTAKTGYQAAVWVRRTLSGNGVRISLGDDCGKLLARFQGTSDREKEWVCSPDASPARPIGHWNNLEITLAGTTVIASINNKEVGGFSQCDTDQGLLALELLGSEIEFRAIQWRNGR